jgi:hypothetical protein
VKRALLCLLAATSLASGAPAFAQGQFGQGQMTINQRQAELDARIDAGVRSRTLTLAEAAQLRAEFAAIAATEARYRANGRGLTPAERADLDNRFDMLSRRIQYDRNDDDNRGGGQNINQRQIALDARIDAGLRDRSLTAAEAAQLRREFQDIARDEANYRANGRGLTAAERAALDSRFDALERRIRIDRNDNDNRGGQNINQRQRELDARIDAGVRDRTLTPAEAAQLRREFQDIARDEANYRANGRGLTVAERAALDSRFDALERRIRINRSDDDRRWTNLDQRQVEFNNRLNQAVRDRRLSYRAAANLRNEFANIARLERQYRRSRPGITQAERADLNARFNRMEANFRASVTNPNGLELLFDSLFGR